MPTPDDDEAVTRREIDRLIGVGSDAAARVSEASQAALERAENLREERWRGHDRVHELLAEAEARNAINDASGIAKALDAVTLGDNRAREALRTALDDHHREHLVHEQAHAREHLATDAALSKAEAATEKRFESVNEFREQLRTQAGTFASRELVDQIAKDVDRRFAEQAKSTAEWRDTYAKGVADRFEAQGRAIIAIEKGDVKQEGKGIGQAWVFAGIATVIAIVGSILGIVIILANLLTK